MAQLVYCIFINYLKYVNICFGCLVVAFATVNDEQHNVDEHVDEG